MRISGYTSREVKQQVYTGRQISVEELLRYQSVNPDKSVIDTVKGLAKEEAQLPPLYFVMVRLWAQWLGSSVAMVRSLSAVMSLFAFPCLYWLCLELFDSPMVGSVAVMLLAASPFQVLYAQEARMYSLWSIQVLLTSTAFLRAIRLNTKFSWGIYAATIVLGLYTHLLSTLVIIISHHWSGSFFKYFRKI
ncbi:MAG: glycosyltransferase family 39 protein [Hydrococcus sp. C42_A2020_068]|nr:glycosyltransferase family 39 protein [Hydrococcus sp. C42_A2020_068]